MLDVKLSKPSLSLIRTRYYLENLQYPKSGSFGGANIYLTGRTGSGKTTLINLISGCSNFDSTGKQDCTKDINVVDLNIGLRIFDLPGACSKEKLENYNRAALDLPQLEECEQITYLIKREFSQSNNLINVEKDFPSSFQKKDHLKPDIILYVVAQNKGFNTDDQNYLKELLKKHSEKLIIIFNLFPDQSEFESEKNCKNCTELISNCYQDVFGKKTVGSIEKVNCRTGEGIDELIHRISKETIDENQLLFQYVMNCAKPEIIRDYADYIEHQIVSLISYIPQQKPERISSKNNDGHLYSTTLREVDIKLWKYIDSLSSRQDDNLSSLQILLNAIDPIISDLSNEFTIQHYEDQYYSRRIPIYEQVPVYKKVFETVAEDSYSDQEVYEEPDSFGEGFQNFINTGSNKTKKTIKVKGTAFREVEREVVDRYETKRVGSTYTDEFAGRKKKGETYTEFGAKGLAHVLACLYTKLTISCDSVDTFAEEYNKNLIALHETLKSLLSEEKIDNVNLRRLLLKHADLIFPNRIKGAFAKIAEEQL